LAFSFKTTPFVGRFWRLSWASYRSLFFYDVKEAVSSHLQLGSWPYGVRGDWRLPNLFFLVLLGCCVSLVLSARLTVFPPIFSRVFSFAIAPFLQGGGWRLSVCDKFCQNSVGHVIVTSLPHRSLCWISVYFTGTCFFQPSTLPHDEVPLPIPPGRRQI